MPGREARGQDPVPLPELSSYGFSLRYRGHWGIRLRLTSGQVETTVPPSDLPPIEITLPDRATGLRPGERRRLLLTDDRGP
jgi:hypothetical protein